MNEQNTKTKNLHSSASKLLRYSETPLIKVIVKGFIMITLSEAKARLEISHVSLNKWISKLGIKPVKQGKYKYISDDEFTTIRVARETVKPTVKDSSESLSEGFNVGSLIQRLESIEKSYTEQLREKDKHISELTKNLDQEQRLHAGTMKQLNDAREQMKLIEHQPNEELNHMIDLLERTRESFLSNMELLNRSGTQVNPLTDYERTV